MQELKTCYDQCEKQYKKYKDKIDKIEKSAWLKTLMTIGILIKKEERK